jgi:hypothetical protein
MIARLLSVMSSHPGLIIEQVESYAGLVQSEAKDFSQQVLRRLIATVIFFLATFSCILLAAIALLFWAVNQNQLWLLVLVPFVFGVISVGAYSKITDPNSSAPFSLIRAQMLADARMLKHAVQAP